MAIADKSENLPDHLTRRVIPDGWRVISNPIRQFDSESVELKDLIQTVQRRYQQTQGKWKLEEIDPPDAA